MKRLILGLMISQFALATTEIDLGHTFVEPTKVEFGSCTYQIVEESSIVGTRCPSGEVMIGKDEARLPHLLRCAKLRIACPLTNCN